MSSKLKCFVAMSFSDKQTELLLKKSLLPTLHRAEVIPRCMIRIEHNDDLNNRIINEILDADFVVADLSFARPSVYYEAGFAERSIPVIYTCRVDHLKPRTDDPKGNLRVHFHLQMKNIVTWRSHDDSTFKKRLLRRINYVTRPLKASVEAKLQEKRDTSAFSILPIRTRIEQLVTVSKKTLRRINLREVKPIEGVVFPIVASKRDKHESVVATLYIGSKFHKARLQAIMQNYYHIRSKVFEEIGFAVGLSSKRIIKEKLIICSLEKLPFARLRDELPDAFLGPIPNLLTYTTAEDLGLKTGGNVRRRFEVHVIDRVPFVSRFENELTTRLQYDVAANVA
ncbi:MAG TPA: hypothetical protein VFG32_02060 [Bacteroidota bacterium]|nr:hypothetical protein [Bacteroidota bacterium]